MGLLGSRLIGSEESFQASPQCFLALRPDEPTGILVHDHAVAPNEYCCRDAYHRISVHHFLVIGLNHKIIYMVLLDERSGVPFLILDIYANKHDASGPIGLVEIDKKRGFRLARHTPGSPEIQDNGLALKTVQAQRTTREQGKGEVRRRLPDRRG